MFKKIHYVFLILLITSSVFAQLNFIPMSVDYSRFRGGDSTFYVEVYLSFQQNSLNFVSEKDQFVGEYIAVAEIQKDDSTIARDMRRRYSVADSAAEISPEHLFINNFSFELPRGEYRGRVVIRDAKSNRIGEYAIKFHSRDLDEKGLELSDIQLAGKIERSKQKSEFTKNTYDVIPNAAGTFSPNMPVLYYYAEAYNLNFESQETGQYCAAAFILDANGDTLRRYPGKPRNKPGSSVVLVGGHNVITLPSGSYKFCLQITDLESGEVAKNVKGFSLLKEKKIAFGSGMNQVTNRIAAVDISPYAGLTEAELDQSFNEAKYIASDEERKTFKQLDANGKRFFLANFWKRRDPSPGDLRNEAREGYLSRLQFANAHFGTAHEAGWQTERGRVLLVYGQPDEIERHYMETDTKPYEIWHFHELEGGSIFVFADLSGFGKFELLHSTYSRELYQPNWAQLILRGRRGLDMER